MVIASSRAPDSGVYVLQILCSFHEYINGMRLQKAWQNIVENHAIFRSTIQIQSDGIFQSEQHEIAVQLTEIDWSDLSQELQHLRFTDFIRADRVRGFDFKNAPPHRTALIKRSDSHYQFLWTCHHVLVDRHAILLVVRDLFNYYDSLENGSPCLSVASPVPPFTEYLEWLNGHNWTRVKPFWCDYLRGFHDPVCFPFDQVDHQQNAAEEVYSRETLSLGVQLTLDLEVLANRYNITINTLVQGAWSVLLSRYCGVNDVVFGATRAGRHSSIPGSESIIGPLLNTIPLRVIVDPNALVVPWLQELRAQWVTLRDFEHTPLRLIHRWSEVPSGTTLFVSTIVFDRSSLNSALWGTGENRDNRSVEIIQRSDSPITLFGHSEPSIELGIAFDQRRFKTPVIERMLGHMKTLLEGIAYKPENRLSSLQLLTKQEQHQIVHDWNDTARDYPLQVCAHDLIHEQAQTRAGHHALVDGHRTISYRELDIRSNLMARRLLSEGVVANQLVGILLDRSPEVVIAMLGVLKAGGAFVLLDSKVPTRRLQHILDDIQTPLVITSPHFFALLERHSLKLIEMEETINSDSQPEWSLIPVTISSDNLAYAVYTSGSTGNPKGTLLTHRSLVNHTLASGEKHAIKPTDRRLQLVSISSDVFVAEIFTYLSFGATVVFGPQLASTSITDFLSLVDENHITVVGMPSSYWNEWVKTLKDSTPVIPSSLRLVICGMEKVNAASLDLWHQKVGTCLKWCNAYGPSETTCTATIYEELHRETSRQAVPIGKPIANTRIYLLDPSRNLVPVGVPGEIYIGGEGVAKGYLNQPELTHEKFIPDFFSTDTAAQLYRTGDIGVWLANGDLVFLHRVDHQIKIRGHRVELEEIGAVFSRHPDVSQCVAAMYKEGIRDQLAAYLVLHTGRTPAKQELRSFASDHLPDHMIPGAIIVLDRMPVTTTGKIDRQKLPVPKYQVIDNCATYLAPRNQTEQQLAEIWSQTLELSHVGVLDDFFTLGGDSLLAVQLMAQIKLRLGYALHLNTLWSGATTVETQAQLLEKGVSINTRVPAIKPRPRSKEYP